MTGHQGTSSTDDGTRDSGAAEALDPPATALSAPPSPQPVDPRRTWADRARFWRSPTGQPAWARPALLAVAAVAAVLYAGRLADEGFAVFYAPAVRSMSVSWQAFVFGALDPGATVTLDKLAGAFVPQALAVRLLGFHPWVLALPQVVEGVVAVLVVYRIGRRCWDAGTGLMAAALFAVTPIAASMFGHPMEDGLLTLALVLAADACQHAVLTGRLRPLLWAAAWIGVGFQAKMLLAWLLLPALVVASLVSAPVPLRRRVRDVLVAGLVTLVVSVSWVLLLTVTPASSRPYVDGTTNNSAAAMVFGYNGLSRMGIALPGAQPDPMAVGPVDVPDEGDVRAAGPGSDPGWGKLVRPSTGSQVGWLFPMALAGLGLALARGLRHGRSSPDMVGAVLHGTWLATTAVALGAIALAHTAYLAALAAPVAVLSAAGLVLGWRSYRDAGPARWVLPLAVVVELVWTAHVARPFGTFLPWLTPVVLVAGGAAVALLVVLLVAGTRRGGASGADVPARRRPLPVAAALVAGVAVTAMPVAWSASVLVPGYGGSAFDAGAGPVRTLQDIGDLMRVGDASGPYTVVADVAQLPPDQVALVEYLRAHRDGARFLVASDGGFASGPLIAATGEAVLPMGGFTGEVPHPTLAEVQHLVETGDLRFVLVPASIDWLDAAPVTEVITWLRGTCTEVTELAPSEAVAGDAPAQDGLPPTPLLRCGPAQPRGSSTDARNSGQPVEPSSTARR